MTPGTLPSFHTPTPKSAQKVPCPKYRFFSHSLLSNLKFPPLVGTEFQLTAVRKQAQKRHCRSRRTMARRDPGGGRKARPASAASSSPVPARGPAQERSGVFGDQSQPASLARGAELPETHLPGISPRTFPGSLIPQGV